MCWFEYLESRQTPLHPDGEEERRRNESSASSDSHGNRFVTVGSGLRVQLLVGRAPRLAVLGGGEGALWRQVIPAAPAPPCPEEPRGRAGPSNWSGGSGPGWPRLRHAGQRQVASSYRLEVAGLGPGDVTACLFQPGPWDQSLRLLLGGPAPSALLPHPPPPAPRPEHCSCFLSCWDPLCPLSPTWTLQPEVQAHLTPLMRPNK